MKILLKIVLDLMKETPLIGIFIALYVVFCAFGLLSVIIIKSIIEFIAK